MDAVRRSRATAGGGPQAAAATAGGESPRPKGRHRMMPRRPASRGQRPLAGDGTWRGNDRGRPRSTSRHASRMGVAATFMPQLEAGARSRARGRPWFHAVGRVFVDAYARWRCGGGLSRARAWLRPSAGFAHPVPGVQVGVQGPLKACNCHLPTGRQANTVPVANATLLRKGLLLLYLYRLLR